MRREAWGEGGVGECAQSARLKRKYTHDVTCTFHKWQLIYGFNGVSNGWCAQDQSSELIYFSASNVPHIRCLKWFTSRSDFNICNSSVVENNKMLIRLRRWVLGRESDIRPALNQMNEMVIIIRWEAANIKIDKCDWIFPNFRFVDGPWIYITFRRFHLTYSSISIFWCNSFDYILSTFGKVRLIVICSL